MKRGLIMFAGIAVLAVGCSHDHTMEVTSTDHPSRHQETASLVGPAGEQGPTGPQGMKGATGATGIAGEGLVGPTGPEGPAGPRGAEGMTGDAGVQGSSRIGAVGPMGRSGPRGAQGEIGETGGQGETLVGPTGPVGRSGPAGEQGIRGQTGAEGQIVAGIAGEAGRSGIAGKQGQVGATGEQGAVGIVDRWTSYREFMFDYNRAEIKSSDTDMVSEIATYVKKNPSLQVGLDGSMDTRGNDPQNKSLSDRRINTVRDALIHAGVPAHRIQTGAFGDERLRRDRRVEVLISTR